MNKEDILKILEGAKDKNGEIPMRLVRQAFEKLSEPCGDTISRQAAIEVIDAVFPVDPMKSEYAQGIACGAALAKTYVEQLPSAQPEMIREIRKWINSSNRGNADYFIVDKIEEIINKYE